MSVGEGALAILDHLTSLLNFEFKVVCWFFLIYILNLSPIFFIILTTERVFAQIF